RCDCRDDRADRRGDGSADRSFSGRADDLRHGEGDRQGHGDRRDSRGREDQGPGLKAAVLTVSDGVAAGQRDDGSGGALVELLAAEGLEVERRIVPDDREAIADAIVELAEDAVLVLTTGGTGLGPRDVTPEATAEVIERPVPGIAEAIRADSIAKTP